MEYTYSYKFESLDTGMNIDNIFSFDKSILNEIFLLQFLFMFVINIIKEREKNTELVYLLLKLEQVQHFLGQHLQHL